MPPFVVTKVSTRPARTRSPARSTRRSSRSSASSPAFRLLPDRGRQRRPELARSLRDLRAGRRVHEARREVDHRREPRHGDSQRPEDHKRQGRCSQRPRGRRRLARAYSASPRGPGCAGRSGACSRLGSFRGRCPLEGSLGRIYGNLTPPCSSNVDPLWFTVTSRGIIPFGSAAEPASPERLASGLEKLHTVDVR